MKKQPGIHDLGTLEVESGFLIVTDPCYNSEHYSESSCIAVKKGTYAAKVLNVDDNDWGNRCGSLLIYHQDHPVDFESPVWQDIDKGTGVDSGQAGFFDLRYFNDASVVTETIEKPLTGDNVWYDLCCDRTLNGVGAGVIPFGAVSSSGVGDGYYNALAAYHNGEIIALAYDFSMMPLTLIPKLEGNEKQFFECLRDEQWDKFVHLAQTEPALMQLPLFQQYAQYRDKEQYLLYMLENVTPEHKHIDVEHLISNASLELREKLEPHIHCISNEYEILSSLLYKNNCMELSEWLVKMGINPNPKPSESWQPPIVIEWATSFKLKNPDAPSLHFLEFWLQNGSNPHKRNYQNVSILELPNLNEQVRQLLMRYIDMNKLSAGNINWVGNKVQIIAGVFKDLQGTVLAPKNNKWLVRVNLFGRDADVELSAEEMELIE